MSTIRRQDRRAINIVGAILACLACALSVGCGADPPPAQRIIVAVDRSESTDAFRAQQLGAVDFAAASSVLHNGQLEVWCYDTTAQQVYSPQVPDRVEAVNAVKRYQMIPDPHHLRRRTRPAEMLEDLIKSLNAPGTPRAARVLLLTDGDNDYYYDGPRIKKAVAELAARPSTQIAIVDVTPDNMQHWETLLQPVFGSRCVIAGLPQADDALHQFLK